MSFLGTEKIKELINTHKVIEPIPDASRMAKRIKNGAYELSLGNEVFRTDSKDKKKEILKQDKEQVTINPGQFALLLTEESVNIPQDKIAFISIKAGVKLRGLVNVSGFHVDPGFKGNLVFSVYNAGTSPISLEKGEPYFLIWFSELKLADNETTTYNGEHKDQDSIPTKYIDALIAGELASPNVLLEKINDNYKTLDSKATTRDYIFRTGIGILIVIALKLFVEWGMYSKGYDDGFKKKAIETTADSTLNDILTQQKTLLIEVDSLEKVKANLKTSIILPNK
ncbi:MAG: deoxycytidine triphosphate deaminase [Bacteroidia bacterium]